MSLRLTKRLRSRNLTSMAKMKKKTVVKTTPKKTPKPSKSVKKSTKLVKVAKPAKVAAKSASKSKAATAKKDEKLKKVKDVPAKLSKAPAKPTAKASVDKVVAAKTAVKDIATKAKGGGKSSDKASDKSKKSDKEHQPEEFEDEFEEEAISYGDAIRLTAQDLEDPEELILTDAEGRRYCKVKDCDQLSIVEGFCRLHYLALWKKIQIRKKILTDGKLEKYIEELTSRYPDKYIEMIRRDLKTEKDFLSAIQELEIDDSAEGEFEEDSSFVEEIRGISSNRGDGGGSGDSEF